MNLGTLMGVVASGFVIGAVLMALSARHVEPTVRRQRWLKFAVYVAVVQIVLGCALMGRSWLCGLALVIVGVGAWELRRATRVIATSRRRTAWAIRIVYVVIGSGFLATVLLLPPARVAFVYVVVAAFDGFSQVSGQWLGRHPLTPRLSPGKTIEGLAGGLAAALLIAWCIRTLAEAATGAVLAAAAAIAVAALAGDLAASWVKRRTGIKDFSRVIPGHGGMLDRFDSFIAAGALLAPFVLQGGPLGRV